jgi:hypothetical protein
MTDRADQALHLARLRWWRGISEAYPRATDLLDAGCEPGLDMGPQVDPEHIPYLVLFADVDWTDEDSLLSRAREWRELFGG